MLEFFIFSYNRGAYLRNCVQSIENCAPGLPVTIIDDDSTDRETIRILNELAATVTVVQPRCRQHGRHGGLYHNMQLALQMASDGSKAVFIQDDMMLVRQLQQQDLAYVADFYHHFHDAAFLNPVFLKGKRRRRDYRISRLHPEFPVYFRHYPEKKNARGISYADAVIADVNRLRAVDWKFSVDEISNAENARHYFGRMGFMAYPFIMFLPQVTIYRGGRTTLGVRMAERRCGTSPKAFKPFDPAALSEFLNRPLSVLPHAELFLKSSDPRVRTPFVYSTVNAYPLAYCLHKCELWLRKLKGR
jgi:glycosyltransferase involved in cell wall biosynthesis